MIYSKLFHIQSYMHMTCSKKINQATLTYTMKIGYNKKII